MQGQELDSVILVGHFQLSKLSDSVKIITQLGTIQACGSASTSAPNCHMLNTGAMRGEDSRAKGTESKVSPTPLQTPFSLPCTMRWTRDVLG